jgi:DNA-binding CsgD family transcriptional regulator
LFTGRLIEIIIQRRFAIMESLDAATQPPAYGILLLPSESFSNIQAKALLSEQLPRQIEANELHGPALSAVEDLDSANIGTRGGMQLLTGTLRRRPGFRRPAGHLAKENSIEIHRPDLSIDLACDLACKGPLAGDAVFALVEDLVGARPAADLIDFAGRAEGDSRLITDLILGMLAEDQVDVSGTTARLHSTMLPERLITAVRQRLGDLSPACRQLVTVAAMLAEEVTLLDVAEMLGETPAGLLPGLEEATYQGLLIVRGESMTFASELLWLSIRRGIPLPVANALRHQAERLPHATAPSRPPPAILASQIRAEIGRGDDGSVELNDAEWDIVLLVRQGMTNTQIASRLTMSRHTVSYHLRKIYRRLNVASRAEMVGLVQRRRSP